MFYVSTCLLFDRNNRLLIYLRDDIPTIPFPNHWDLFGGIIEDGESPEQALVREIEEEIGVKLDNFKKFRDYNCFEGDIKPNKKYVFYAKIDRLPENLKLDVGQKITSINLNQRGNFKFANILAKIVDDFYHSGIKIQ